MDYTTLEFLDTRTDGQTDGWTDRRGSQNSYLDDKESRLNNSSVL